VFRLALSAALGVAAVLACGPFFGIEALQARKECLLAAPSVIFDRELAALVPAPKDKLPVVEFDYSDAQQVTRDSVEAREFSADVLTRISSMRAREDGEEAYGLGEGLPPALRQYTAGAVSFLHGQRTQAQAHFEAVLALPDAERKSRELWAHFMLGRVAAEQGNETAAAAEFQATRALARHGTPDPLGLAVASLGEEARESWRHGAIAQAVNLYAQQAAYGSRIALNSLVMVAGLIVKDRDLLDKGIEDPLTRRLIFICVNKNSGVPFFVEPQANDLALNSITVDRIVAAMERHHVSEASGAGLLASAAYERGDFDLAGKLSALEDVPISAWVRAKLALRSGDRPGALMAYEKALKGYGAADQALETLTVLRAESGVLRVSRGDLVQALDLFYRATNGAWGGGFSDYWGDAAYLAERVLTLSELRDYVDGSVPAPLASQLKDDPNANQRPANVRLRSLLARRLMRAGRRKEALRYFDDEAIRSAAEEYGEALNKAAGWWRWRSTRAQAWFSAAQLAHSRGLELLGFERAPDFAMWEGEFNGWDFLYEQQKSSEDQPKPKDAFQTEDERKRVAASAPERNVRFQYRMTATDHAMKSADLLPPSSQAFAAVLCEASRWVIDRQPARAHEIYRRYLHEGAYVSWGRGFGRSCPPADFAAASRWGLASRLKHWGRHVRAHPIFAGLAGVGAIAGLMAFVYFVRRFRGGGALVIR
jgi:hypothetical protein